MFIHNAQPKLRLYLLLTGEVRSAILSVLLTWLVASMYLYLWRSLYSLKNKVAEDWLFRRPINNNAEKGQSVTYLLTGKF
jgi:uncharacterized membrane protein